MINPLNVRHVTTTNAKSYKDYVPEDFDAPADLTVEMEDDLISFPASELQICSVAHDKGAPSTMARIRMVSDTVGLHFYMMPEFMRKMASVLLKLADDIDAVVADSAAEAIKRASEKRK